MVHRSHFRKNLVFPSGSKGISVSARAVFCSRENMRPCVTQSGKRSARGLVFIINAKPTSNFSLTFFKPSCEKRNACPTPCSSSLVRIMDQMVNWATVAAERKEEGGFGLSWIKVKTLILFSLCCYFVLFTIVLCFTDWTPGTGELFSNFKFLTNLKGI